MAKKKKSKEQPQPETVLSFEKSLADLEDVVRELESGNLSLSDSLSRYEEGIRNLKICHTVLETAENRIRLLTGLDQEGNPSAETFDADASDLYSRSTKRSAAQPDKPGEIDSKEIKSNTDDNVDDSGTLF
ncbi:MAG: exodeoxyribonuclease VII small subunit [Planctomycetota bacterium]|jgi:exodeoxyribonuclease VII small subunit|nr:exodeoxyribonuclease VII small subunit [Planctomycetota bacterium]